MKIYGATLSPFTRKVLIALNFKGIDYELIETFPGTKTQSFLKISPLGKIPAVVDGDLAISDSAVICQYLEDEYPENQLLPDGVDHRTMSRWLEKYADTALAETTSSVFWELAVKPMLTSQSSDLERVAYIKNVRFPEVADYLESKVPVHGYFFGAFGLADISLATQFMAASYVDHCVDGVRWPHLAAYLETVWEHPLVKRQRELDKAVLAKLSQR